MSSRFDAGRTVVIERRCGNAKDVTEAIRGYRGANDVSDREAQDHFASPWNPAT